MVMTNVVAFLFGISRIKWDSPPAWAAEWDSNSLVTSQPTQADEQAPAPRVGVATQPAPSPASAVTERQDRMKRLVSRLAR
ncbi:hypothetical protein [Asaia astilbis]|uniref:hypothetical protein n=1 Tax=Asaia astilbis TaxID=610244 RepID=UPI000A51F27D|nr:hypothetical protein [Asaia astilbis]